MKKFDRILILALSFLVVFQFVSDMLEKDPEPVVDHTQEIKDELKELRREISEIHKERQINYEKVDTISTSASAHSHVREFIDRTNEELPPGFNFK